MSWRAPLHRHHHVHVRNATHVQRNSSRARLRPSRSPPASARSNHAARHGPNCPRRIATAFPASTARCHDNDMAPLDTACTNHMRNSQAGFSDMAPDQTPVYFGSRTCKAEAKGTYATVPGVLYVPDMAITALWSFWQLLDQCHPMVVNFHGTNNSNTWGFYVPGNDSPVARAERHGNTFLISTHEVRKLLSAARRSALALSATTSNKAMFWHRALGCLSWQSLRRLRNADRSSQVKFTDAEFNAARVIPCDGCLKGRMTKPKVFKQSRSGSDKPTRPFQHVQADIMVNRSTTSREGFKYVLVLVCIYTRIVYGYGMERKSEALSRFKRFRDDICAFTVSALHLPAGLGFGNDIEIVRTDVDGVFTDTRFTDYARTSGVRLETTSPNQSSPYIVDRVIRTIREMTRAYLYSSNLSMIWWYAATKCAIYVINRLPRPPHKSPIETFSGKPWDMSRLQPFGCMCHYHIPKVMRGPSAALKPTSAAGIFVGYSLTSHKYAIFVFSTGAIVERSRVYFSPDVFPDDLGGVVSPTNRSTRNTTPGPTFSITTATADDISSTDDETTEPTSVTTISEDDAPSHESKMLSRTMVMVKIWMTVLTPKQRAMTTPSHT